MGNINSLELYGEPAMVYSGLHYPQGYSGVACLAILSKEELKNALLQVGAADFDNCERVAESVMKYGSITAEVYPSPENIGFTFTELRIQVPAGGRGENIFFKNYPLSLETADLQHINDKLLDKLNLITSQDLVEFVKERAKYPTLTTNDVRIEEDPSCLTDKAGFKHITGKVELGYPAEINILASSGYLAQNTSYYLDNATDLDEWAKNKGIEFDYRFVLNTDGTGELLISHWQNSMTFPLSEHNLNLIKGALDEYHMTQYYTYTVEDVLNGYAQDNEKILNRPFCIVPQGQQQSLAVKDSLDKAGIECETLIDSNAGNSVFVISAADRIKAFDALGEDKTKVEYVDSPFNPRDLTDCDMPHIVKAMTADGKVAERYIETYLSLEDKDINNILARAGALEYEGSHRPVNSLADLAPNDWINVYAKVDKNKNVELILQIDGEFETKSGEYHLPVSATEAENIGSTLVARCAKGNVSFNDLCKQLEHNNRNRERGT